MSDNLNSAIKQITDMLTKDPDSLKELIGAFTSSDSNTEKKEDKNTSRPKSSDSNELNDNIDVLTRIKSIMDRMDDRNDPRVNLLSSIRPFLSRRRKSRLNNAIKFLKVYPIIEGLMEDNRQNDNGAS